MVDTPLEKYVRDQLEKGYPEARLVEFLLSQGYSDQQVLKAVDRVRNQKSNPWKAYAIVITVLAILGVGYVVFELMNTPFSASGDDVGQLQALLFVSEVRHAMETVPLTGAPKVINYNIPSDFEQVCIVDSRTNPAIGIGVISNSLARDRTKNLFLLRSDPELGFQTVASYHIGTVSAQDGYLCVPVKKGWVAIRFSPGGDGVIVAKG